MSDDEIVRHYETVLMSTDIYPIELHRRLYLILKDEANNGDWQSVSGEVYSVFAEYGNREYKGEVLYRTELVNKDGISIYFGEGSTYLPWIFVANIINAMIVDGVYPGDFTQLFEEARKILEKAEYVVSDEYLMTAVLELQKEKIYNPTARQIAEQTEAVIVRDAVNIDDAELSAVEQSDNENSLLAVNEKEESATVSETDETPQLSLFGEITDGGQSALTDISSDDTKGEVADKTEIDENAEFKILEECTGSHHGQIDMLMTAYKGEIPVGYMKYSIYENIPNIDYIEVMPSQRRRGIATRLLQNLQGQYPTSEIVWGALTDDGKALHDAITYSYDSEDYESVKRGLEEINKGLAEFQQRIDDGEVLNDDETVFINDLSDNQYKLEKQLEDLSPTHTFVRLPKAESAVEPTHNSLAEKPPNFRYSEDINLYPTGLKSKYKANIEAIKLLKTIEEEKRQAMPDEQFVLARYVGWGGLSNAFNPKAKDWEKEYGELKLLLTESEYKAAMDSTLTAYYTEPEIIKSIYTALDNFGFEGGKNRRLLDIKTPRLIQFNYSSADFAA